MENQVSTDGIYIASLVLGICSILFCAIPLVGLTLTIVSLIISVKARKKLKKYKETRGIVTAGLVLSIVGMILAIIVTIFVVVIPFGCTFVLNITEPKEVSIPNLVGLTTQEAEQKAKDSGLKFEVEKEQHKDNVKENTVISQEPPYIKNYKVKSNTIIKVIINK